MFYCHFNISHTHLHWLEFQNYFTKCLSSTQTISMWQIFSFKIVSSPHRHRNRHRSAVSSLTMHNRKCNYSNVWHDIENSEFWGTQTPYVNNETWKNEKRTSFKTSIVSVWITIQMPEIRYLPIIYSSRANGFFFKYYISNVSA